MFLSAVLCSSFFYFVLFHFPFFFIEFPLIYCAALCVSLEIPGHPNSYLLEAQILVLMIFYAAPQVLLASCVQADAWLLTKQIDSPLFSFL